MRHLNSAVPTSTNMIPPPAHQCNGPIWPSGLTVDVQHLIVVIWRSYGAAVNMMEKQTQTIAPTRCDSVMCCGRNSIMTFFLPPPSNRLSSPSSQWSRPTQHSRIRVLCRQKRLRRLLFRHAFHQRMLQYVAVAGAIIWIHVRAPHGKDLRRNIQ